jgi:hypothetical protein
MKIFPLTIYVLLKPFIQILPSDSKKSLWDSRTTATLTTLTFFLTQYFFSANGLALCMLQRVRLQKFRGGPLV